MNKSLQATVFGLAVLLSGCGSDATHANATPPRRQKTMFASEQPGDSNAISRQTSFAGADSTASRLAADKGPDHYFPLKAEQRWEYDVEVVRADDPPQKLKAVKRVEGDREIAGKRYVKIVTEVTGGTLRIPDQYYRVADDGVYAAVQGAEGRELLILPARPDQQRSWQGEAKPAIEDLSGKAATGETFTHGANRFRDCIKVTLSMVVVERTLFGGERRVPVRFDRWFAPGVGMVREVRTVGEEGQTSYFRTDSQLVQ
jgi:hypothetical protein